MNHSYSCMRSLLIKMLCSISAMLFLSSIAAPVLETFRMPQANIICYCLRYICHQIPSRCLWILDSNMGLCTRCFGIYLSFFICMIAAFFRILHCSRKFIIFGVFLLFPLLIDGVIATTTHYTSNNLLRVATGMLFGFGSGLLVSSLKQNGGKND
ncbi:MAG: DUF2085 domain-containing protein [Candidatus Kuenenia sp.]|nr:DUF2085 domain-containing protein [Candidatus Kuenenia hertensis]